MGMIAYVEVGFRRLMLITGRQKSSEIVNVMLAMKKNLLPKDGVFWSYGNANSETTKKPSRGFEIS